MDEAYQHSCEVSKTTLRPILTVSLVPTIIRRSAEDILELCKTPGKVPRAPSRAVAKNKALDKCLRIGLVSDGLRLHPVGQMIVMGLEHVPASQIQITPTSTNYGEIT